MPILTEEEFIDSPWVELEDCVKCDQPFTIELTESMDSWCYDCLSDYFLVQKIVAGTKHVRFVTENPVKQDVYEEYIGALMWVVLSEGWGLI